MKFKVLKEECNTSAGAIAATKSDIGEPLMQPIGSFISTSPSSEVKSEKVIKKQKKAKYDDL